MITVMREVELHGAKAAGRVALVDDEDYGLVNQYRWRVFENPAASSGPYAIAETSRRDGGKRTIYLHTLITGYPRTDHEDHNGLNNQRYNMRDASTRENAHNMLSNANTSSEYKGVSWVPSRGKWLVQIKYDGKNRNLGRYDDEIEAAEVYDRAAREHFGEFAHLNFELVG
jgi:hypothetical protein